MITATKSFGSYILKKPVFSINEETQRDSGICGCTIPGEWTALPLVSVRKYNHDTSIFKFGLPSGCSRLNLPIGGYLLALAPGREHDGSDAVRPYTSITDEILLRSTEEESDDNQSTGYFEILCKRYDEWGVKESVETHFLFTRTNHSYHPPGAVSTFIHTLQPGQHLKFKFNSRCEGRIGYPFPAAVRTVTMIAVGVGIAPMIQTIRAILRDAEEWERDRNGENGDTRVQDNLPSMQVVLLYGVRTVQDILMRELLDEWHRTQPCLFKVVYCVGSRWSNVHFGVKTKGKPDSVYRPPPLPAGFEDLVSAELGWVDGPKIRQHGFAPAPSTRVLVCGLPGVYEKLCGPRDEAGQVATGSVLAEIGYTGGMVIKL